MGYLVIPVSRHGHVTIVRRGYFRDVDQVCVMTVLHDRALTHMGQETKRCKNDRSHYRFREKYVARPKATRSFRLRSTNPVSPRAGEVALR